MKWWDETQAPTKMYLFPITMKRYNKMATYFIDKYISNMEYPQGEKNNGNNLHSKNINFGSNTDSANSKEIN